MFTRKQYINKEVTHSEYYGQYVTDSIKESIKLSIGLDRILKSKCEHFNDIPLVLWDRFHCPQPGRALSDTVCIYKEAARQLRCEYGRKKKRTGWNKPYR